MITTVTKDYLDSLAEQFETEIFIKDDPVQFLHKFQNKKDIEIAAFVASLLAYGNRKVFIRKLNEFFDISQNEPHNYILSFEAKSLNGFNYRFGKEPDFIEIFTIMKTLYSKDGGLEALFMQGYEENQIFNNVVDYFYSGVKNPVGQGFYHMIPNPHNGGAMKRMCMYLRWLVRKSCVAVGIWDFMPKSELYIPLDVHVGRVSREMGLLKRNSNDFKAVIELTENLKKFDPEDPVKYDFALFGYGVARASKD